MRVQRLKYLAREILPYVPAARFDMTTWRVTWPCGTVACAFGYACASPLGRADGLQFNLHDVPTYRGWDGTDAAARYYDIPDTVSRWLFLPSWYYESASDQCLVTAAMVAERIELLLAFGRGLTQRTPWDSSFPLWENCLMEGLAGDVL